MEIEYRVDSLLCQSKLFAEIFDATVANYSAPSRLHGQLYRRASAFIGG